MRIPPAPSRRDNSRRSTFISIVAFIAVAIAGLHALDHWSSTETRAAASPAGVAASRAAGQVLASNLISDAPPSRPPARDSDPQSGSVPAVPGISPGDNAVAAIQAIPLKFPDGMRGRSTGSSPSQRSMPVPPTMMVPEEPSNHGDR